MDVLVVGGGIAGLTAALHAHEAGHRVELVVKDVLGDGATALAQGGIAGVYGPGDSPAKHAEDTLIAGAGLSDPSTVAVLVAGADERIAELVARGVPFDRDPDGRLLRGLEAAHSAARIAHAGGDATGAAISAALVRAVRDSGIGVHEHTTLVDLLVSRSPSARAVRGARVLTGGRMTDLEADAVILATGGAGQLFRHTTAPAVCTGDGIAAALRAGAAVADLEFVQFHPTILDAPGSAFLISEAVRGEGAILIDDEGRRFAFDAHPDGELAPRDVVTRAVVRCAREQGSPVRLDASVLCTRPGWSPERLARRFPTIDRVTRERGFDWAREPIPVTPAAHYLMGGIVTDADGRSSLPGLYAVGETARTGVHGANRLASNSLLEGAVFGARAAAALLLPWPVAPRITGPTAPIFGAGPRHAATGAAEPGVSPAGSEVGAPQPFTRAALQELMWDRVGPVRTVEGLTEALAIVRAWRADPAVLDPGLHLSGLEDRNLLEVAEAMITAALARPVSIGAHHLESPALIGV